ncbi:DUF1272 domain-containing protein [Aquimarina aquimarini]|uniref:DUF1272 domain-containing protein n=1 Tax=Aquimarina aquimarini TaxID=1191734 RepID=UPI000D5581FB|nr:DUF1272 domain-containing protein [Aquimarina aquimarini]
MLEMRPTCENCNKALPNTSDEAMICTFECTYCTNCVDTILYNVCPNCGGGFEKRPTRPTNCFTGACIEKYPTSTKIVHKPINKSKFEKVLEVFININPRKR